MLSPLFSEVQLSAFLLTLGSKYIIIILFFQDCYYRITLSKSIFCHFFFLFCRKSEHLIVPDASGRDGFFGEKSEHFFRAAFGIRFCVFATL